MSNLLVLRIALFFVILLFALIYPTLHGRISAYNSDSVPFSGYIQKCDSDTIYTGRKQTSHVKIIHIDHKEYIYRVPTGLPQDSILKNSLSTVKELCKGGIYVQGHYVESPTKLYSSENRIVQLSQLETKANEALINYFKRSLEFLSSMVLAILLYSSLAITLWGAIEIKRARTKLDIENSRNQRFRTRVNNKAKKAARKKVRRNKRI